MYIKYYMRRLNYDDVQHVIHIIMSIYIGADMTAAVLREMNIYNMYVRDASCVYFMLFDHGDDVACRARRGAFYMMKFVSV